MLIYTIEHDHFPQDPVRKTLHIEGKAENEQKERLKTILLDALGSSDYLIVNIEKLEGVDNWFASLIGTTRRMAKLLGKRLTIKGKGAAHATSMH